MKGVPLYLSLFKLIFCCSNFMLKYLFHLQKKEKHYEGSDFFFTFYLFVIGCEVMVHFTFQFVLLQILYFYIDAKGILIACFFVSLNFKKKCDLFLHLKQFN